MRKYLVNKYLINKQNFYTVIWPKNVLQSVHTIFDTVVYTFMLLIDYRKYFHAETCLTVLK